jgi:hypothetical protein
MTRTRVPLCKPKRRSRKSDKKAGSHKVILAVAGVVRGDFQNLSGAHAKPKTWVPTSAEQALLVDLVTARIPRAAIAKRMGISEMRLRRFEKRLLSAREAMPPPAPPRARERGSWLDRLFGDS